VKLQKKKVSWLLFMAHGVMTIYITTTTNAYGRKCQWRLSLTAVKYSHTCKTYIQHTAEYTNCLELHDSLIILV